MSSSRDLDPAFLQTAKAIVLRAGEIHLHHLGGNLGVILKEGTDIVTAVDIEVENMARAVIAKRFPEHSFLGEELGETVSSPQGFRWLFDPLDGTVNYAHGLPIFSASLALEVDGEVIVGAVFDASRQELFAAQSGRGATVNDTPIRVSGVDSLSRAAVGAGFPHGAVARDGRMENVFCNVAVQASAIRRLGSAALDLCCVACGRLDAFWDANLKPWDTAAGALIVQEAGGQVTTFDGQRFSCYDREVLATNGRLHSILLHEIGLA